MQILRNKKELDYLLAQKKEKDHQIGLIPTMGGIHEGHLSLVKKSIQNKLFSLVTIYINPTQFNAKNDYLNYPREEAKDIEKLYNIKCDALYFPEQVEMYPNGLKSKKTINKYRNILCDKFRPGHFDGVTTVVESLLGVTNPDYAFFGEKDAQQFRIVKKLITDLNFPIKIISSSIVREENGLAMSSRNEYLTNTERGIAAIIQQALQAGKNLIISGERNPQIIRNTIINTISAEKILRIDYVSIADSKTLMEISNKIEEDVIISIAVYLGEIRLIDNFSYSVSSRK